MEDLRFRQIHMDFHTSEQIKEVGQLFDPEEFAETLSKAYVNSVTCFARCHHGMLYYESKKFPDLIHPGLADPGLLKQQIDACHKRGIKVPVYTTVQWDYHMSQMHPDWCCINEEGGIIDSCGKDSSKVYEPGFYRTLCVNSPYREYLKEQIEDIFSSLGMECVDGIFLDIVNLVDCSCGHCVKGMKKKGYHPEKEEQRVAYAKEMLEEFKREMTAFIHERKQGISVFYNGGHIGPVAAEAKDAYTHFELESLPGGEWGYSHFSDTVRYARTLGKQYLSHTGKFHTSWGDFHSLKNPEALQYECYRMLAYGSRCLIGDQLNPDGKISQEVYQLIGSIYQEVEKKEPWCADVTPVSEIALFTSECQQIKAGCGGNVPIEVHGACMLLDELGMQFDIVDNHSSFEKYSLLILPDEIVCEDELADKIEAYVTAGGALLVTGSSGFSGTKDKIMLPSLGLKGVGEAPYKTDFFMPSDKIGKNLPKTEFVMYEQGMQVAAKEAKVLAETYLPYFDRTWEHFCSHRHTPSNHKAGYPFATEFGRCIYMMHPIFGIYSRKHPKWCKEAVKDAIERLLPNPVLSHNGPTTMIAALNKQEKNNCYVLHALHYIPIKNAEELYTIEDVIPLHKVRFSIREEKTIQDIYLVPKMQKIPFTLRQGRVEFELDTIDGHAMAVLSYEGGTEDEN